MGAAMMGSGRKTGRKRRGGQRPMSEINVTPFVDVMLVLLIVFMVTAPLLTVGVPVDLPKAEAGNLNGDDEPLVVSINGNGEIFVQDTKVEMDRMIPLLMAVTDNNPDLRIFVRGDQDLAYGQIMAVMGKMNKAGFRRVALVAELPQGNK